jgi:DNA-binding transcriptional MerR regulator
MAKSAQAFRTIREVADWLDVAAHVLRFWESKFPQIKPVKRAGGRRYYRPADMELVGGIKVLLHDRGLTIRGVQKMISDEGIAAVTALSPSIDSFAEGAEVIEMTPTDTWADDAEAEARATPDEAPVPGAAPDETEGDNAPEAEVEPEADNEDASAEAAETTEADAPPAAQAPEAAEPQAPAEPEAAAPDAPADNAPAPARPSADPAEGPLGTLVALSHLPATHRGKFTAGIAALARLRDRMSQDTSAR